MQFIYATKDVISPSTGHYICGNITTILYYIFYNYTLQFTVVKTIAVKRLIAINRILNKRFCYIYIQTRFQKSWDTVQIVNKKGMQ